MTMKKLLLKAGINRENTSYTSEGGWYNGDKVRFRQGTPEKIGGWEKISDKYFLGVCRSLHNWVDLNGLKFIGVATHKKLYIEMGQRYYDVTPIRLTSTTNQISFALSAASATITVSHTSHGATKGDFVTFTNASTIIGTNMTAGVLNQEYEVQTVVGGNSYTITARAAGQSIESLTTSSGIVFTPLVVTGTPQATSQVACIATYQLNIGKDEAEPIVGWGAGTWNEETWGHSTLSSTPTSLRLWTQNNFGEDLVCGFRGSPLYLWDASAGISNRAVLLSSRPGANATPEKQNFSLVSDNRFIFCFGTNPEGSSILDPMLVRWSDFDQPATWNATPETQAGDLVLSNGSELVAAVQGRQEILVWSDAALYSFQYLGGTAIWGAQIVGENVSIASTNAATYAGGMAFWMGKDKFYVYDGVTKPLKCNVRQYIFNDFNTDQYEQVFSGTVESYHEIWWFYCSSGSSTINRYVVYNYLDNIWYYGTIARTAWLDSSIRDFPLAATYTQNIVDHEKGVDNKEGTTTVAITSSIESAQFDLDDGYKFMFVHRILPDLRFDGSTATNPALTMSVLPLKNSGSGYSDPASEGGVSSASVTRSATVPIEKYTEQINTRIRGRQIVLKIESTGAGVQWQLGAPRFDMRPDGRR